MCDGREKDELLISQVAGGDEPAFHRLVDAHYAPVFDTCCRILGNREDAEDVTQDVFVQVHRKARTFRGESKLSTWLYRISVNLCLNHLRKRKRERFLGFLSLSEPRGERAGKAVETPESRRPDSELEADERSRILNDALEALPDRQRAAIVLNKCEGLSHQEIADVLLVTPAAVESLVHRAKVTLQRRLLRSLCQSRRAG
jgi:RNA polymerase sigma-70 factor (ECF subfamily)